MPKSPRKTPRTLRTPKHGKGQLMTGGTNAGGAGRPPSAIREQCRGAFAERVPILVKIAEGEFDASVADRIKALDLLGRYGGIDKLALTAEERPASEGVTPALLMVIWQKIEQVRSIRELEKALPLGREVSGADDN